MVETQHPVQVLLPKMKKALHKQQEDIVGMVAVMVAADTMAIVVDILVIVVDILVIVVDTLVTVVDTLVTVVDTMVTVVDSVVDSVDITVVVAVTEGVAVRFVSLVHDNSSRSKHSKQDIVVAVMVNVEVTVNVEVEERAVTEVITEALVKVLLHLLLYLPQLLLPRHNISCVQCLVSFLKLGPFELLSS